MLRKHLSALAVAIMLSIIATPAAARKSEEEKENAILTARATPKNATPLGVEIGYANILGVRTALAGYGVRNFQDAGVNAYTGGKMYQSDPSAMQVDGLKLLFFIFSEDETLEAVIMTFRKDPLSMAKDLSSQYKLVSSNINGHMNFGEAHFEQGDSVIDIIAPHLSFDMEVEYKTKELQKIFEEAKKVEAEKAQSKRNSLL